MSDYRAPVEDMDFVLQHVVNVDQLQNHQAFSHVEASEIAGLLEEAGRFFSEVIAPTNRTGDIQGSQRNNDGSVTTPDGIPEAYQKMVEAGWGSISFDPEYGGGGFPVVIGLAIQEMLTSANMGFSLCPLLTQGAVHLLAEHASEEQKLTWVPKMVSGEWTGTMNLTEPQAGSDVGALTAKAVRNNDGSYAITGQKIFITWGDHDVADNIVHLVLARTADAPPGTKGISVFIVPKYLLNDDGTPGQANTLECVSLEHKLGIHCSPTAVMAFEDATGYLIGEEQTGMRSMFTMMNSARLSVGLEGLAVAERAYQQAVQYSFDRTQGGRPDLPKGEVAPIVEHPDVRRMLITMKASIEAMRSLCYLNAKAMDDAHHADDDLVRVAGQELAEVLTPLSKAWCTDLGNELTSIGLQVHGGMGFIEETGAAQHYRDIRIGGIYEGTNGIQAIDLIGRKLPIRDGAAVGELLDQTQAYAEALSGELASLTKPLVEGVSACRESSAWLLANHGDAALAGATPYLRLLSTVVAGGLMAKGAAIARAELADGATGDRAEFLSQKLVTATFFIEQLVPAQLGLLPSIMSGNNVLANFHPVV
ncbi:MAG: alkylation response protein AidB-like acyl-CoA dehydrogenase [Paracrocinitomix sp.]|jgi:alkylation response protein AidB-like acyl-CoA dehydrogenase